MYTKKERRTVISLIILLIIAFSFFCYSLTITIIVKSNKDKLDYRPINITTQHNVYKYLEREWNTDYIYQEKDKSKIRKEAEKLVGLKFYIYKGVNKNNSYYGFTNFHFRYIKVLEKTSVYDYSYTIVHELIHLKYYNANEMWVNFMTFKLMYESDNPDFQRTALIYAYRYVSTHTRNESGELVKTNMADESYDISYYIVEYLGCKTG